MRKISIADNGTDVFVYMNRNKLGNKLVDEFLNEVRLFFSDNSHIPEASDKEQAELEKILSSLTPEEKEPAIVRKLEL